MNDQQILGFLNSLNDKIDRIDRRVSDFIRMNYTDHKAEIDYIALMTDVELPSKEDEFIPKENTEEEA